MKKNKEEEHPLVKVEQVFIIDESTKFWGEGFHNAKIITSQDDLECISSLKNDLKQIIIFCELKWSGRYYSDFYGLEIAQRSRREYKITASFIFCSFLPKSYFYDEKKLTRKSQILKGRGSYFLQLPFIKEKFEDKLKSIIPLSQASLIDVIEKCCDPIGTVIDKLHPLKSQINKVMQEDFNKLINELDKFLTQEQKESVDYVNLISLATEKLSNNDYDGFRDEIKKLENNSINLFNATRENQKTQVKKSKIPVLLLEDNTVICETIKEELSKRNIDVIYFQNSN